jgi:hypothetical protein
MVKIESLCIYLEGMPLILALGRRRQEDPVSKKKGRKEGKEGRSEGKERNE